MKNTERIAAQLPLDLRKQVDAESEETGLSISDIVRIALQQYFAGKQKAMSETMAKKCG